MKYETLKASERNAHYHPHFSNGSVIAANFPYTHTDTYRHTQHDNSIAICSRGEERNGSEQII